MHNHNFPYDNLAKRIGQIAKPYSIDKFESIFRDISSETKMEKIQQMDIQNDLCDIYLISPKEINQKYHPVPPAYFFYKIQALLIRGEKRFYILIHLGNDGILTNHTFNQAVAGMRTSPAAYRNVSPGRFIDNASGNIISAEEDEFDIRYILVTNSEWLLEANEIFNFSRDFFTI